MAKKILFFENEILHPYSDLLRKITLFSSDQSKFRVFTPIYTWNIMPMPLSKTKYFDETHGGVP